MDLNDILFNLGLDLGLWIGIAISGINVALWTLYLILGNKLETIEREIALFTLYSLGQAAYYFTLINTKKDTKAYFKYANWGIGLEEVCAEEEEECQPFDVDECENVNEEDEELVGECEAKKVEFEACEVRN